MSVSSPGFISAGAPVLASGLTTLLVAADERLRRLYSGGRSWFAFNTASVPAHQIPSWGAIYVLSANADRVLIPSAGTAGCPHGGNWPAQYDHAAHVTAANAMTISGGAEAEAAWEVTGAFAPDVYSFGDSLSILERNNAGDVRPLKLSGSYAMERFHRYAVADVLIESASERFWDYNHDKYGVVRFHNLSAFTVTVRLGASQVIEVYSERMRTVRRLDRTGLWDTSEMSYFPKAASGDIPIWDSATAHMENLPLRSQRANPIFHQAMLQSMFRPWALTDNPGLFSDRIVPVLPDVGEGATVADAIIARGEMEVIRTKSADPAHIERFTLLYSGESLSGTPPDWANIGLAVSLDDSTRGAVLQVDPAYPAPTAGVWYFDIISRSTNLTGGIVVPVKNGTVTERVLLPWFEDAAAADDWYLAIFVWPEYQVTRTATQIYWVDGATWTATGGGLDSNYFGSWGGGTDTEVREYLVEWNGKSYATVSAWNVFSKVLADALPSGGTLVRQPLLTAVMSTQSQAFWVDDSGGSWDDANSVQVRPTEGMRGIDVGGDAWGLGTVVDGELLEPRWQYALFPTIGYDPLSVWSAYPFKSSEPIIWTPLLPSGSGNNVFHHWRTTGATGAAHGAPWDWDYVGTHTPIGNEPDAAVDSRMRFWRMFSQESKAPGSAETYKGKCSAGPQPWPVRDHGWLADQVLSGGLAAAGDSWSAAKADIYDSVDITGGSSARVDEARVGFQIRMAADAYNQLAALLQGITHVRPCSWEQHKNGFSFTDLVTAEGWAVFGSTSLYAQVQPFGAAHVYGVDSAIDIALDDLGVTRRSLVSTQLQALQSVSIREYYAVTDFITGDGLWMDDRSGTRPSIWTSVGNSKQYCTPDDIHAALSVLGFAFNVARFVQPITVSTVVPGTSIETEVDTYNGAPAGGGSYALSSRSRLSSTSAVPADDDSASPELQWVHNGNFRIAAERPMRSQVIGRLKSSGPTVISVRRVGSSSGATADALDRLYGEFDCADTLSPPSFLGGDLSRSRITWWSGSLVARSGLRVKVLAQPMREVLSVDRAADEIEERCTTNYEYNSELVLPDNLARPIWLEVGSGESVTIEQLTGSAAPAFPDKHHVWQLLPMDPSVEVI